MARDNPRRITRQKLLRYTMQQCECTRIQDLLKRHKRAVQAMNKAGWDYNEDTGAITPKRKTDNERED